MLDRGRGIADRVGIVISRVTWEICPDPSADPDVEDNRALRAALCALLSVPCSGSSTPALSSPVPSFSYFLPSPIVRLEVVSGDTEDSAEERPRRNPKSKSEERMPRQQAGGLRKMRNYSTGHLGES